MLNHDRPSVEKPHEEVTSLWDSNITLKDKQLVDLSDEERAEKFDDMTGRELRELSARLTSEIIRASNMKERLSKVKSQIGRTVHL